MAKSKYLTIEEKTPKHRATGGKSTGPGGGSLNAPVRTAPSSGKATSSTASKTSAGSKGSGTSSSWGGPSTGTGGKGNAGTNVGGNGRGPSGGMMGGSGSGGPSRTAPSSGGGGGGPKSSMGGQGSSFKSPEEARHATGKAINKSFMDNTRAQNEARMATERAKGFGPRVTSSPVSNVVTPSSIAAQNTLDRIASGSSVIGRQNVNKLQDQVPKDPTKTWESQQEVKLAQPPNLGQYTSSAFGPPTKMQDRIAPSQQANGMFSKYQDPVGITPDQTVQKGVAYNNGIPDTGIRKTTNAYTAPAAPQGPAPTTNYGPVIASAADPYGIRYAKTASYVGQLPQTREVAGAPYGSTISPVQGAVTPSISTVTQAQQPDMGQYSPTVQKLMDPVANWAADKLGTNVSPSQQDSRLVRLDQAIANTFGTPGPDSAYARAMSNAANRASERPAYTPPTQSYAPNATLGATEATAPIPPALAPLPPYVNYQQLPPDYSTYTGGVAPSQPITDFINGYGGTAPGYASGGLVGDSNSFEDRLNYGLKNAPSKDGFFRLAYALGMPEFTRGHGNDGWHQVGRDMRMAQMVSGQTPASKPQAPATPSAPEQPGLYPQLSQYVLPPPNSRISDYNNADVLGQQGQLFRLPEKRGGGVGDGIDAAIRLAKSFS